MKDLAQAKMQVRGRGLHTREPTSETSSQRS